MLQSEVLFRQQGLVTIKRNVHGGSIHPERQRLKDLIINAGKTKMRKYHVSVGIVVCC